MSSRIENVEVKRWSFCKACRGTGCSKCGGKGVTEELIPLSSIDNQRIRKEYAKLQADFINEQRRIKGTKKGPSFTPTP